MTAHTAPCDATSAFTEPAAAASASATSQPRLVRPLSDRRLRDGAPAYRADLCARGIQALDLGIDSDGWVVDQAGKRCVALDTETGGLDPTCAALLAISVQPLCVLPVIGRTEYIWPADGLEVSDEALRVNGLNQGALADMAATSEAAAMRSLQHYLDLMGDGKPWCICAHGADFDRGFITAWQQRTGQTLCDGAWGDTRELCRSVHAVHPQVTPPSHRNSLDTLFEILVGASPRSTFHQVEQDVAMLSDCVVRAARCGLPIAAIA